jgi:hypothetical protein
VRSDATARRLDFGKLGHRIGQAPDGRARRGDDASAAAGVAIVIYMFTGAASRIRRHGNPP